MTHRENVYPCLLFQRVCQGKRFQGGAVQVGLAGDEPLQVGRCIAQVSLPLSTQGLIEIGQFCSLLQMVFIHKGPADNALNLLEVGLLLLLLVVRQGSGQHDFLEVGWPLVVGQGPGQHDQGLVLDNAVKDQGGGSVAGQESQQLVHSFLLAHRRLCFVIFGVGRCWRKLGSQPSVHPSDLGVAELSGNL